MMSSAILHAALPRAPSDWLEALLTEAPRWGIDSDREIASFAAELAYESNEFTHLEENLHYSAERLLQVWPRRFPTLAAATPYAGNPIALANLVYANRNGNGNATSGDGWYFRGRGPTQLTFRANYERCARTIGAPIVQQPDLLLTPTVGIRCACWYWSSRGLDRYDDDDTLLDETRAINGGTLGEAARQAYFDKLMAAFTSGAYA